MTTKEKMKLLEDCLAGALTIMHYEGILDEKKSVEIIEKEGFKGLFNELDHICKIMYKY